MKSFNMKSFKIMFGKSAKTNAWTHTWIHTRTTISIALCLIFGISSLGYANGPSVLSMEEASQLLNAASSINPVPPIGEIKWKVGDTMEYDVLSAFGKVGTSTKTVFKDDGTSIWVRQSGAVAFHSETVEVQIRKADGQVLKVLRNGKEQSLEDSQLEIISHDHAEVTVPAGRFKTLHIVGKMKEVPHIEVWSNTADTLMDGTVKQYVQTSYGNFTFVLTRFKSGR